MVDFIIRFCLERKLVVALILAAVVGLGVMVAPFDWDLTGIPRRPVPVDAIPDIGENQQIVFTSWPGRSPQDVEDQISYPLTVSLLGIPGVRTVRSYSMFGFSTIYVIFKEDVEFYWSRSRILEKLSSLPAGTLPAEVKPALGPDATALGQIYWYTLEGRDPEGNPTGGWDPQELRSIQDWTVRYALMSADGISEVASVGGFVKEYQIDVDPDAMRAHGVRLQDIFSAVRSSNIDVGARTIEINAVEYVIRGLGFIKTLEDIENVVVSVSDNVPIRVRDVARVKLGPAGRRGILDKEGAEAVGGVCVVRYGENPLATIENLKKAIKRIQPGLPRKTLADGTVSQVTIVPFYDRTELIHETLATLGDALYDEILITIIVVLIMVGHLRSSMLIAGMLPLAVLLCFIAMKGFGIDANIVALSGIAIAIGTIVDMGVILCENVLTHLREADPEEDSLEVVYRASSEVGGAIVTAVGTTIVSFLPVFAMEGSEGKLFGPLAWTKTFALTASVIIAITVLPAAAHLLLGGDRRGAGDRSDEGRGRDLRGWLIALAWILVGLGVALFLRGGIGALLASYGVWRLVEERLPNLVRKTMNGLVIVACAVVVAVVLARHWMPLGLEVGVRANILFSVGYIGLVLGGFHGFMRLYPTILRLCLAWKPVFLALPTLILIIGLTVWLGFDNVFGVLPAAVRKVGLSPRIVTETNFWIKGQEAFPGLSKEFMPNLDEGSYLYMPTTMPHASIGEAKDVLSKLDQAIASVPEVKRVVGKAGRAETPLDPAPISMVETIVQYKSEFRSDDKGRRLTFKVDEAGAFVRDEQGELIRDPDGRPFRQWRDHIRTADDIWREITKVARLPGTTSAPKLQPIAARIVMLQSGMRAPMGIKLKGPSLEVLEEVGLKLEQLLGEVEGVEPAAVIADRVVGKPYLEIDIDRQAIARYGIRIRDVQDVIEIAIGGRALTRTIEGRERYPVRVRYQRELRDTIEAMDRILVAGAGGVQIPLDQISDIQFVRGPQVIKSEDTFLVSYVLFDKKPGYGEVDVVERCRAFLEAKIESGELELPSGVSYVFAGSYENQVRAMKTLRVVMPAVLLVMFILLYLEFKRSSTTLFVFSTVLVAWAGGFIMIWLYGQPWFMDFDLFGTNARTLLQVQPINLSVAVWVGFIALFGLVDDDGVVMATYLEQSFAKRRPDSIAGIREAVVQAGLRRIRPCLMTTATTVLALLPVLTSTGKGSDIMVPMAIPTVGGLSIAIITLFMVPTLYCMAQEWRFHAGMGVAIQDLDEAGPESSSAE